MKLWTDYLDSWSPRFLAAYVAAVLFAAALMVIGSAVRG